MDGGTVRRKVFVADRDLVASFGQRDFVQRRRGADRRAVDLDLAPGADRQPHQARGQRGEGAAARIALAQALARRVLRGRRLGRRGCGDRAAGRIGGGRRGDRGARRVDRGGGDGGGGGRFCRDGG